MVLVSQAVDVHFRYPESYDFLNTKDRLSISADFSRFTVDERWPGRYGAFAMIFSATFIGSGSDTQWAGKANQRA